MNRKIAEIIVLVLCCHALEAQNFATRQLEYLYGLMDCTFPQQSDTFYCPKICALPLLIEYDQTGAVCHLGVVVFSESIKKEVGKPVCDFQERLFLEVFLQGDEAEARKLLDEYKVKWTESYAGSASFFKKLEYSLSFASKEASRYVLTKDSLTWMSSWSDSIRFFDLKFLSNFDLILGMDKKEAETWFAEQLRDFHCDLPAVFPLIVETGELMQLNRSVYVRRDKNLFTQYMNRNLYFLRDAVTSALQLIYDRKSPEETIANLFNHPDRQSEGLDLQIKQVAYSGESQSFTMKLSDFQCFMRNDYETFVGIETCTADTVEFSVIYKSKLYNCWHLLFVQTTPQILFDKSDVLKATFYTFIPNHNIKNLYKEFNPNIKSIFPIINN